MGDDIFPEQPASLMKWKTEIDAHKWIVAETTQITDGQDGLATTLQLKAFGELGFLGLSAETGHWPQSELQNDLLTTKRDADRSYRWEWSGGT